MNNYLVFLTNHLIDIFIIIGGLTLDIYLLINWKRTPKSFTTLYKIMGFLVGLITIYSGILLMVTDFIAITPK